VEQAVKQWADLTEREGVCDVALMSDASTSEIDRMNARAQHLRAERGELGESEIPVPDVAYGLREGDRVAFIAQHRPEGERRVENGTRGEITSIDPEKGRVSVLTDGERHVSVGGEDVSSLRLSYAQHLYRQQGATVDRAVVVTGGWQTNREGAYVQASRAREGTDWHVSREDLGTEGVDAERVSRLAGLMRVSRGQVASIAFDVKKDDVGEQLERSTSRQLAPDRDLQREVGMGL
jgi:ATP-dependent exoDNAse (exonuclease V) alpha subunit